MPSAWITHVKEYRQSHPGMSYKETLKEAKQSYHDKAQTSGGCVLEKNDMYAVDFPLLIRLLEYAKEDAKTDIDLHNVAERMRTSKKKVFIMKDYNRLVKKSRKGKGIKTDAGYGIGNDAGYGIGNDAGY
jgi:hypothetical protein